MFYLWQNMDGCQNNHSSCFLKVNGTLVAVTGTFNQAFF